MTLSTKIQRILSLLTALVILKVTAAVVWKYRDYLPPDFQVDFLRGRESYFYGPYQWAFYAHIITGPFTLIVGLLLIGERFRQRFPAGHRLLGRAQALTVLLALAPSGLWMAYYAQAGLSGQLGFGLLAVVTAFCTAMGWRTAVQRRFVSHRRWMMRSYVLLCSAVIIRLIGGLATVTIPNLWLDQFTPWISWLAPLAAYEWVNSRKLRRLARRAFLPPDPVSDVGPSPVSQEPRTKVAVSQLRRAPAESGLSPIL